MRSLLQNLRLTVSLEKIVGKLKEMEGLSLSKFDLEDTFWILSKPLSICLK
jgi:hypothetical protein